MEVTEFRLQQGTQPSSWPNTMVYYSFAWKFQNQQAATLPVTRTDVSDINENF